MKTIFLMLVCIFALAGCSHKKTREQYDKEYRYYQTCLNSHMVDGKFDVCKKQFKDKFGYPYNPNSDDQK